MRCCCLGSMLVEFFHILGMSSSQLTFIVFRGVETTNQNTFLPTPGDVATARHGGRKITLQIKGEW